MCDLSYSYCISIIWDNRHGELFICEDGAHIEFDDDGSWLDFNVKPRDLLPGYHRLSEPQLGLLMSHLASIATNATSYSSDDISDAHHQYEKTKDV